MPFVMCKRTWGSTFHRTIDGVRVAFPPGEPIEVPSSGLKAIVADLGHSLIPMEKDGNGVLRPVADSDIPEIIDGIREEAALEKLTAPEPKPESKQSEGEPLSKLDI